MKSEKLVKDYLKDLKKDRERIHSEWMEYDNVDDLESLVECDHFIETLEWVLAN